MIAVLLRFIKDQLHPPVKVHHFDVIDIFRIAVARMPHITDHIPGRHHTAFLQSLIVRKILAQMGIIVIPFPVKAADADPPSAIPVPSQRFYIAGFDGYDRRTDMDIILTFVL